MVITVTYLNNDKRKFRNFDKIVDNNNVVGIDCFNINLTCFPENMNFPNLERFWCCDCNLTRLPENMNFPNLKFFSCYENNLTSLPENMNFPNLKEFICGYNKLTSLPENMNFPNLEILTCNDNELTSLPENMNFPNLKIFSCRFNKLTSLPENINLPNLKIFKPAYNKLTSLPENMNFPNLEYFDCSYNKLKSLPENMNFPNLETFNCWDNKLTSLPENMNFPNLRAFRCGYNKLISLPDNMNFPNLREFHCGSNYLTSLPENMNFPNLRGFYCSENNLTCLPLWLMNCRHLYNIYYDNNEIVLSPQMARFINALRQGNLKSLSIYNDNQNIHNSNIQLSVKESIDRITTRTDLECFNKDKLYNLIIDDTTLNCKEQLIEYCNDVSVHSLLLLTFPEVLWYVLKTIEKDFNVETQKEIKSVLNEEMKDTMCKCFTGRMSRIVNCLNGFSDLVKIEIKDESQIGNIIVLVRDKLGDNYSVEKHKEEVEKELKERGYVEEVIEEWVSYIE